MIWTWFFGTYVIKLDLYDGNYTRKLPKDSWLWLIQELVFPRLMIYGVGPRLGYMINVWCQEGIISWDVHRYYTKAMHMVNSDPHKRLVVIYMVICMFWLPQTPGIEEVWVFYYWKLSIGDLSLISFVLVEDSFIRFIFWVYWYIVPHDFMVVLVCIIFQRLIHL